MHHLDSRHQSGLPFSRPPPGLLYGVGGSLFDTYATGKSFVVTRTNIDRIEDLQNRGGSTMPYLLVRYKVTDYEEWKAAFDAQCVTRQASGSRGGQLFRNAS